MNILDKIPAFQRTFTVEEPGKTTRQFSDLSSAIVYTLQEANEDSFVAIRDSDGEIISIVTERRVFS